MEILHLIVGIFIPDSNWASLALFLLCLLVLILFSNHICPFDFWYKSPDTNADDFR